jgi:hypothetical protein
MQTGVATAAFLTPLPPRDSIIPYLGDMWVERTKVYRQSFTEPKNVFFRQSYLLPKERQGWGPSRNTSTLYVEVVQVGGIEHLAPIAISHFSLTARYRSDEEDYFKARIWPVLIQR